VRAHNTSEEPRVCIVGSGTFFLSGISYYTYLLARTMSARSQVSVILMRRLIPKYMYPGRDRVGVTLTEMRTSEFAPTFDGVDWYAIPSLFKATRFLRKQHPDFVIIQWWTGATVLSYLAIARTANHIGAQVILEFHEDQDTGEKSLPLVETLIRPAVLKLISMSKRYVVHSQWDKDRLCDKFALAAGSVSVIPHGPYRVSESSDPASWLEAPAALPPTDSTAEKMSDSDYMTPEEIVILYFGVIRPFKGVEDLVDAFDLLPRDEGHVWKLLVVGESWENWTLPADKIRQSPHSADIEFVNRYIADAEIPTFFGRSHIVVLPYHRSSASGPLHITMRRGLPVVVTAVGGLSEAAGDYPGTVFVQPKDPVGLTAGILKALPLRHVRHADSHSWSETSDRFMDIFTKMTQDT
jgi:glycosyltransferase involved in cell wall biosynthesis